VERREQQGVDEDRLGEDRELRQQCQVEDGRIRVEQIREQALHERAPRLGRSLPHQLDARNAAQAQQRLEAEPGDVRGAQPAQRVEGDL
jgi:hypothetical protein